MVFLYLDSSALVKLLLKQGNTLPLQRLLNQHDGIVTSQLSDIEVTRAVKREKPDTLSDAKQLLRCSLLLSISDSIVTLARELEPVILRSLDAIHVATALAVEPKLAAFVSYDIRQAEAAKRYGLKVLAPE